ncbi:MAG: hypothetical protein WCD80_06740 [Desulfobaccales bacterium]
MIRFALGTAPGVKVAIYNPEGQQVGMATVEASSPTDSAARATTDQEIKVGYLVCRA